MNWFIIALKRPFEFHGRARRREYWYFLAFSLLITVCLSVIDNALGWYSEPEDIGILSGIFSLLIVLPSLSVTVRRLHDTGRSGWWILLYFLPLVGFLILLYFIILDGNPSANQYGNSPKTLGIS